MEILDLILALVSIALGLFGWLAPRYTMSALDLLPGPSSMGASEIRASVGALFVGLGIGAIWLGTPEAMVMMGAGWAGAAIGRGTSLVLDGRSRKKWVYFWVEAVFAALAILANL